MTDAGMRVIAFDLPSHGKSYGGVSDDLDWFSFTDLADVAVVIERETLEDSSRPLILSGWSTGGLLALRMAQSEKRSILSRYPSGLLLFAPAVSVPACVGDAFCQITNETLTHDHTLYQRYDCTTDAFTTSELCGETNLQCVTFLVWGRNARGGQPLQQSFLA